MSEAKLPEFAFIKEKLPEEYSWLQNRPMCLYLDGSEKYMVVLKQKNYPGFWDKDKLWIRDLEPEDTKKLKDTIIRNSIPNYDIKAYKRLM